AELQKTLAQFSTALQSRDLDAATKAYSAAYSLAPNDPGVMQARVDLQKAQDSALTDAASRDRRARDFQARLKDGNDALTAGRHDDALRAFTEARILNPDDVTVADLLIRAQRARDLQAALMQFRTALTSRDLDTANRAYSTASLLAPNDPAVI